MSTFLKPTLNDTRNLYIKIFMKKILSFLLMVVSAFLLVFSTASTSNKKTTISNKSKISNNKNNPVILELFTSQGCSSCPRADKLLEKYADMENVVALSYHVDYWNRLGWKDPFSSAAFSQRQQQYSRVFRLNGVYTPQVVINGEKEMVGSDASKIAATLKKAYDTQSTAHLTINNVSIGGNKATVNYSVTKNENKAILNIALIQNKITTSIKSGENGGIQLTNINVVRNFKSVPSLSESTNNISIDLVAGIDKEDLSVALFLQDPKTLKIFAGAKSSL